MRRLVAGAVLVIIIILTIFFLSQTESKPIDRFSCLSDSDCVAATCCHANSSVNRNFAPDCTNAICTMECRSGTIDCGYGEIRCVDKICTVIIK